MRGLAIIAVAVALCGVAFAKSDDGAVKLYVSTVGNDAWSGRLAAPNVAGPDGPFATLERARDEVRKLRTGEDARFHALEARSDAPQVRSHPGGFAILLRGGMYCLDKTFVLGLQDSGEAGAPVVYQAYPGEKPIVIGGKQITGFKPYQGQILQADVGAQGFKGVYFRQLFLNGKRQHLARYPNYDPKNPYGGGWSYVDGKPLPLYTNIPGESQNTLHYKAGDAHEWAHPEEGEVLIFPRFNWWNDILRIAAMDKDKRVMTLARNASYGIRPGDRYFVRNLLEELDSPGEWYLDQRTWTLYFWPPTSLKGAAVYAPKLETLVQMDKGTSNVELRGLTVECGEGTAIALNQAEHCRVVGCTIRNVGAYCTNANSGVAVTGGHRNGVVGCDIYEVGSTGIAIDGAYEIGSMTIRPGAGDRDTLTPGENYADNNYIHHTGIFYKQGVGVSVNGVGNRVSHNYIHDCPRFGIAWGGNDHIIEYNHVRHVNLETCDTGGIYTWQVDWVARGTEIRYNYFHDVLGYGQENGRWVSPDFAWGIYLDDGTCGTKVYGNIVARAKLGGAHIHGGRDNVIENNIFIEGESRQMSYNGYTKDIHPVPMMTETWNKFHGTPVYNKYPGYEELTRSLDDAWQMAGNKFRRNIIYYSAPGAALYQHANLPFDKTESDYNVIWHFGQPLLCDLPNVSAEKQWDAWKKLGFEQHTVIADPQFMDAKKDDWRLRPGSPALKLGFQPIPVEKIGPYRSRERASWPIVAAEGAREHPLISQPPVAGMEPLPRNTTPFTVSRASQPVTVDGVLSPGEWPAGEILLKQTPSRTPIGGAPCVARLCYDDRYLYVTLTVPVDDAAKLALGSAWGKMDGAEVCFSGTETDKPAPVFVVYGFASGAHKGSTDAGASEGLMQKVSEATVFAAKVGERQWTGEWAIPWAEAGLTPRTGLKLAFNMATLRTESGEWIQWVGALGQTWRLHEAGYLVLK